MPSWFSKVFKSPTAAQAEKKPRLDELMGGVDTSEDPEPSPAAPPKARKVVYAPVLETVSEVAEPSADIRIKARIDKNGACVVLVDRPVLDGHSAWFANAIVAKGVSPLAEAIFAVDGVETVLLHGFTVTVTRKPTMHGDWQPMAQEIGNIIRGHLIEEKPVVTSAFLEAIPGEEAIRAKLQRVIEIEINPSIAAHSGAISLDRVEGNTVYIQMMGGCQGCAASDVTLRQGIYEAFRHAVPQVGAILDNTDHSAGKNPFYAQLPAGMR